MFENRADIQPFLAETELGLFAAEIAGLCKPNLCFEPSAVQVGGTRFGGEPHAPPDFSWPEREAYVHGAALAARLARRGEGFASRFTNLGGWPIPEQGDPRFTAAASANGFLRLFDRSPTEAEACSREVPAWTMLLQVDMASLGTDFAEGTVYFVMRADDLARRNFSCVHAIYQQT